MRRFLIICVLLSLVLKTEAQQYGLFNTRTLFDAFENPAQKAFVLDSSRKFASNFLLPYLSLNATNTGDANKVFRRAISDNVFKTSDLPIGNGALNHVYQNSNIYLLTFRIFQSYKYHKELGFSWQVRTDGIATYTNESLAILNDYQRFSNIPPENNLFNNNGYGQSYHQFSITYRENYTKKLAFGVKLSLLSGISYNKLDINGSSFSAYKNAANQDVFDLGLRGTYKATFMNSDELSANTFMPSFRNPGASIGFGTTYTSKSGYFLMANIKDLGFIKWNNDTHNIPFNGHAIIENPDALSTHDFKKKITDIVTLQDAKSGFYSLTNAKADITASKSFGAYTPMLILSKNLFFKGGDAAFVNTFKYNEFSASLIPDYNFNGFFMTGLQGMYKTPNFEAFLGTDNLIKTISLKSNSGSGYYGASFYMGIGIKFGGTVEHPLNSSHMPGVGDEPEERSFFKKLFHLFEEKN